MTSLFAYTMSPKMLSTLCVAGQLSQPLMGDVFSPTKPPRVKTLPVNSLHGYSSAAEPLLILVRQEAP